MIFYDMYGGDGYASYVGEGDGDGLIVDHRVSDPYRVFYRRLVEYLGDPPVRPRKKGHFHASGYGYILRVDALPFVRAACREGLITKPVEVEGREYEDLHQIWVINSVDCLDIEKTSASPASGFFKGKIGVIKSPVFDGSRWDGSHLFTVPQDPNNHLYCTDEILGGWMENRFKGAVLVDIFLDPRPIKRSKFKNPAESHPVHPVQTGLLCNVSFGKRPLEEGLINLMAVNGSPMQSQ